MSKNTNLSMLDIERMLMDAARMGAKLALHEGRALLRWELRSIANAIRDAAKTA